MKISMIFIATMMVTIGGVSGQTPEEYFRLAAENNPGLQAKYKEFQAALEKVAQVGSLPDPTLSFGYFISPVETRVGPQRARFSLSQMLPWFGTLKAQEEAASLIAEARYETFVDASNQLYFQVASAWYPLYELTELRTIEAANVRILESYKTLATSKLENGTGSLVDILRVDILLKEAMTNLEILEQKEQALATRFNNLLNRPVEMEIDLPDSLAMRSLPVTGQDSLWADHPILNELELKLSAMEATEKAAGRQGLPKIGLGLDYVIVGERQDMAVPENGKDVLMPMVSVSIPIYRNKYRSAKKEAQLMQENYLLLKQDARNKLITSYELSRFEVKKQHDLLTLYEEQIVTSQQSLSLLFTAYGNSGNDFEEVLLMQQQLLKYRRMRALAFAEYHVALAELEYLLAEQTGN